MLYYIVIIDSSVVTAFASNELPRIQRLYVLLNYVAAQNIFE